MISMSDYPHVRSLFSDYRIEEVQIRRNLRGNVLVTELLIMNY